MVTGPCGACKHLRRKCVRECVFAPFFPADNPDKFASIHTVFGASNLTKILSELPRVCRGDAIVSLIYEAESLIRDPTKGPLHHIQSLQMGLEQLQEDIKVAQQELATLISGESSSSNDPPNPAPSLADGRTSDPPMMPPSSVAPPLMPTAPVTDRFLMQPVRQQVASDAIQYEFSSPSAFFEASWNRLMSLTLEDAQRMGVHYIGGQDVTPATGTGMAGTSSLW
ncbi:hypothetical protein AMTRI_Chr13g122720 [Amborella trichopoda]